MDFLTGSLQVVKVGSNTCATLTLNMGDCQGCMLSPFLYSLFTHDRTTLKGAVVKWIESFEFLCVSITKELSWSKHTNTVVNSACQLLFPLRRLKMFGTGPQILKKFYSCTIESILTGINFLASNHKVLERVMHTAQYITGAKLPAIQDFHIKRCGRKAR